MDGEAKDTEEGKEGNWKNIAQGKTCRQQELHKLIVH